MSTTWTVVLQPSRYSPHLQPTGFAGTWREAEDYYQTSREDRMVNAWAAYLVPANATEQQVETGRTLKIAPTKEQKAAAKARVAKIAKILADDDACMARQSGWSALRGYSRRVGAATREETAAYAADHGMTWSDVCRTQG